MDAAAVRLEPVHNTIVISISQLQQLGTTNHSTLCTTSHVLDPFYSVILMMSLQEAA